MAILPIAKGQLLGARSSSQPLEDRGCGPAQILAMPGSALLQPLSGRPLQPNRQDTVPSCCSCSCSQQAGTFSSPRQEPWALHRQPLRLHRQGRQQRLAPVRVGTELGDLISSEEDYRKAVSENDVIVIDWMARWCRKCVYLSPKLRKLMQEDFPDIPIIFVDVNAVPGNIVYDAGIRKMPTITLFRHGDKVREHVAAEGGLKAITHIREMIKSYIDEGNLETDN